MKRTIMVCGAGFALVLAGCSSSDNETGTPTVTGPDASIVATVDCGDDGVANVRSAYGTGEPREQLIGRNSTTSGAGGSKTYSSSFGTQSGMGEATLSITTSPTKGTCTTTLTDYNGGDVLVQKETSGEVTVEAVISSGD